jgi:hypothetical protein
VAGGPKSSIYPRLESVGDADEAVAKVIGNLVDDLEPARVMATIWRGVTAVEAPEIFPETSLDDRVAAVIESVLTENSAEIGSLEAATHREVRFDIFYPRFAGKLRFGLEAAAARLSEERPYARAYDWSALFVLGEPLVNWRTP